MKRESRLRKLFLGAVLFTFVARCQGGAAADDLCDAGLKGNDTSPSAYQSRGDRCEGLFKLEVNSMHLRLSSIVESFEDFDTSQPEDLTVEWSLPPDLDADSVKLRASSLVPRTYYRMDTAVVASRRSFSWSLDILDQLRYTREDIGVLGWIRHPKPPASDRDVIYLPLRIRQRGESYRRKVYDVALTPEKNLDEVYISASPTNADGVAQGPRLYDNEALGYGYYPAKFPTFFELAGFKKSGLYEVEIKASFADGGSGTLGFFLYHEEP